MATYNEIINSLENLIQNQYPDFDISLLKSRIKTVNQNISSKGIVFHEPTNDYLLTGYDYLQFYDWDLYFENIYALYNGENHFCFSNLNAFFSIQEEDGFIKRSFGPHKWGASHPFKPFIAQTVLLGCNAKKDYSYAEEHLEQMEQYLNSFYTRYDYDQNGLCCWINADASGMDNQNSRVLSDGHGEGVDLNCYLYREYLAMEILAQKTKQMNKAELYRSKALEIKSLINNYLWDEETGFYYDRNDITQKLHKVKGVSGFIPLWAGVASEEQAKRLVNEHLLNSTEFNSEYPIPTLAMDEPAYKQFGTQPPSDLCNWNGTMWIPTNYMIFHGLMKYGYMKEAKHIAEKTFETVFFKNTATREYYNAITAEGYGRNPFFGWSTLAYFMPLEFILNYDSTEISDIATLPLGQYFDSKWEKTFI